MSEAMSMMSDDDFNEEIVEIFVEEVDEVLALINEQFPIWRDNADADAALKEVRRAFHTLKGSGRMVQAEEIGELAWSVESLLNRIMDKTLAITPSVYELIEDVVACTPTMVEAFKNRQAAALAGVDYTGLIAKAEAISSGKDVSSAMAQTTSASSADTQVLVNSDVDAMKAQMLELSGQVQELCRDLVTVSTQLDTLSAKVNLMPKDNDTAQVEQKIASFENRVVAIESTVKSSLDQVSNESAEARQKLSSQFERKLADATDLNAQLKADFQHESEQLSGNVAAVAAKWAIMCSTASAISVFLLLKFL